VERPLSDSFRARGVRLVEFGACCPAVPQSFGDPLAEQRATRSAVGLYDFSFMACLEVRGAQAAAFFDRLQTRNLARLSPGRLAYTLLLRDDGSVLIDATVWRLAAQRYWLMTGRRADVDHVRAAGAGYDIEMEDRSGRISVIAVQGPQSAALLRRCGAANLPGPFGFAQVSLLGHACVVARVGYTGEHGYELFVDAVLAPALWSGLAADGRAFGIAECGLEAADALRIEAGFILFTHELASPVTPYELGLLRLLDSPRPFMGAEALAAARWREPARVLAGFVDLSGGAPGPEASLPLRPAAAPQSGTAVLTSVRYSALLEREIGMGFVRPGERYPGTRVRLQTGATARVARLPFYDPPRRLRRRSAG